MDTNNTDTGTSRERQIEELRAAIQRVTVKGEKPTEAFLISEEAAQEIRIYQNQDADRISAEMIARSEDELCR